MTYSFLVASQVLQMVEEVQRMDIAFIFNEPVPLLDFPVYIDRVHCPMDLGTIATRLRKGYYRHIEVYNATTQNFTTRHVSYHDIATQRNTTLDNTMQQLS